MSVIKITAAQADAIAALARLYMSTRTLRITSATADLDGWIVVKSQKWQWLIDREGRVASEGPDEEPTE